MARPLHCLSATPGCVNTVYHNTQCSSPTLYTHTVYIELHGRRQAGSEGQGRREGEYNFGGTEGVRGGREGGSDDVRQGRGE